MMVHPRLLACAVTASACTQVAGLDTIAIASTDASPDQRRDGVPSCPSAVSAMGCPSETAPITGGCLLLRLETVVTEIAPFCADVTEVTAGAYRKCVEAERCPPIPTTVTRQAGVDAATWIAENALCTGRSRDLDEHPVNCISAVAADAYCAWVGGRLPTRAEWEWLAHGGAANTAFPWGNESPMDRPCWLGLGTTCKVASHAGDKTTTGVFDLAGNVGEWTSTAVTDGRYSRGGSFASATAADLVGEVQTNQTDRFNTIGFRCVRATASATDAAR